MKKPSFVVEISDTGIPDGVVHILESLPSPEELGDSGHVILRFTGRFVFTTALTLLAAWRSALPTGITVEIDDSASKEATRRLLTNSGFRDVVENPDDIHLTSSQVAGKSPLQPIIRGNSTEGTIRGITKIFDLFSSELHDVQPFKILLSELCENAFIHAEAESPGFISSNYHKTPNRVEVTVVDTGIGVRSGYDEGTNEDAKRSLVQGINALDLALRGNVSSKRESAFSHFGYGLLIVRRLIQENRGLMIFVSGDDCVFLDRYQQRHIPLAKKWPGTFVGLVVELNSKEASWRADTRRWRNARSYWHKTSPSAWLRVRA